jgi:hypothetical protein
MSPNSSDSDSYFAPILVYLTRPDKTSKSDDVIKIRPSENNERLLNVLYLDKDSKKNYTFDDTWDNVVVYLQRILTVLPYDSDPFNAVQFTLPAYPSVMIKVADLEYEEEFLTTVFDMMKSVVNGWPVSNRDM